MTFTFPTLIRGAAGGSGSDPKGANGVLNGLVEIGSLSVASDGSPNEVDFIFREQTSVSTYTRVRFAISPNKMLITAVRSVGGVETTAMAPQTITGSPWTTLKTTNFLVLQVSLTDTIITIDVFSSNINEQVGAVAFTYTENNSALIAEVGRVGWGVTLVDRDFFLLYFDGFLSALAQLTSKLYEQLTPVEGIQLTAAYAEDTNVFQNWTPLYGSTITQDSEKVTGDATFSYLTSGPIVSNSFLVNDFGQLYLDCDIWITSATSFPTFYLSSDDVSSLINLPQPVLQANQWNHVRIEFGEAGIQPSGFLYNLYIGESSPSQFWIANVEINQRNVSWQTKSIESSSIWYEMGDMVNQQFGALHFPRTDQFGNPQRGKDLRIRAIALTPQAWVSGYTVTVKHAQLGKPLYYQPDLS